MVVGIATGTRADWGLLSPLAVELREMGAEVRIYATHAHLMPEMGDTLKEVKADGFEPYALFPACGDAAQTMAMAAAGMASALGAEGKNAVGGGKVKPDVMVLLGDRCEMLGVASAAFLSGVPIVHIAGGTVSEGAFDDSIRHAITKMAALHFPETELSALRIRQMGEASENVIVSGALGVENALKVKRMTRDELRQSLGWDPGEKFLVVTLHAVTTSGEEGMDLGSAALLNQESMLRGLEQIMARTPELKVIITYPNADIEPAKLIWALHDFESKEPQRIKVVPSLGRLRYLSAVALSMGVVGNSSSGLVEVPSLGVPTLDIGDRQHGRECGESVIHCGIGKEEILAGLRKILSPEVQRRAREADNPYYRPDAAGRMAREIMGRDWKSYPAKRFILLNEA